MPPVKNSNKDKSIDDVPLKMDSALETKVWRQVGGLDPNLTKIKV